MRPGGWFFQHWFRGRELGVTQAHVRAFARRLISCRVSPGGQWRTETQELDRLRRDGLPQILRQMPQEDTQVARGALWLCWRNLSGRLSAADEVVQLENQVQSLALKQQIEERRDRFRERAAQEAERQAEKEAERGAARMKRAPRGS